MGPNRHYGDFTKSGLGLYAGSGLCPEPKFLSFSKTFAGAGVCLEHALIFHRKSLDPRLRGDDWGFFLVPCPSSLVPIFKTHKTAPRFLVI